jgi:hypothetical protein
VNQELRDLYSSLSIIRIIKSRRMRWAGHVARMEEKRIAYRLLVGKPEGEIPLGKPRRTVGYLEVTVHEKLRSGWPGPFVKVEGCCD